MTIDPSFQSSASEQLMSNICGLQSLALDAHLTGHERVAHDLVGLANCLSEAGCTTRVRAVAKEILARASSPEQDFETLLDPFDLAELARNTQSVPSGMAILETKLTSDAK